MLAPASAQVHHTIRSVASCFGLHQRSVLNLDRYCRWPGTGKKTILSTRGVLESSNGAPSGGLVRKRKVVEHIILLRAKPNISDAEEKDMLDYLYTSQYQMRGILAVSLDFESEVEDDIIPLFRRENLVLWQDFNYGVEFMLLISFLETASREAMEDASSSLQSLISQCSSFIVQATCGCCLNPENGYNHAAVIRFPSSDDLKLFRESIEYKDMWASKFHPVVEKSLELHFSVDPVGNQLM
ncbi:uncharacterized protein LOC101783922 isoform X3 [Setaria italica]|uniref:uncharacterized protein LOC101783922 isoform X3 n=1 Tax=Setaria italica TaxID=4555 RepID=UPI0006476F7D|nr:uncharacterized protein LOC101783922 isoform X3 [Setaria italica]